MTAELAEKLESLREYLARMERVVVAFSGGVDSSLVLKMAADVLQSQAIGVLAVSPSLPGPATRGPLEQSPMPGTGLPPQGGEGGSPSLHHAGAASWTRAFALAVKSVNEMPIAKRTTPAR